jgi:hypothetical protein
VDLQRKKLQLAELALESADVASGDKIRKRLMVSGVNGHYRASLTDTQDLRAVFK